MKSRLALVTLLVIAGCAPRSAAMAGDPVSDSSGFVSEADSAVVTLERTACFGTCPIYRVSIAASGAVRFEGKSYVAHQGPATAQIPKEQVDSLLEELRQGGYFDMAERYLPDSPDCGDYATDSPTVITSVTRDGVTKRIQNYYGCMGAPLSLRQLERRIDEVAGTNRWTGS
ncbi:MAG: DUF6438 domain-containing protein [Gemmatimonadota bacterium]|nr:DUF6438 domain-containing protein [Gemmatimonadota bacterium]